MPWVNLVVGWFGERKKWKGVYVFTTLSIISNVEQDLAKSINCTASGVLPVLAIASTLHVFAA